jgi:hypothetical protein
VAAGKFNALSCCASEADFWDIEYELANSREATKVFELILLVNIYYTFFEFNVLWHAGAVPQVSNMTPKHH